MYDYFCRRGAAEQCARYLIKESVEAAAKTHENSGRYTAHTIILLQQKKVACASSSALSEVRHHSGHSGSYPVPSPARRCSPAENHWPSSSKQRTEEKVIPLEKESADNGMSNIAS